MALIKLIDPSTFEPQQYSEGDENTIPRFFVTPTFNTGEGRAETLIYDLNGNLLDYNAVIFTSSNGIRFMNITKFNSKIKCFCVGNATELAARQAGFINTYSSEGTVDSLIELILRTLSSKLGKLLYLSSEFISKDLDIDLINAGYLVDRVSNYTTLPIEEIDEVTLNFIKKTPPDVLFIYSSMRCPISTTLF